MRGAGGKARRRALRAWRERSRWESEVALGGEDLREMPDQKSKISQGKESSIRHQVGNRG